MTELKKERKKNKLSKSSFLKLLRKQKNGELCISLYDDNLRLPWNESQRKNYFQFLSHIEDEIINKHYKIEGNSGKYPGQVRLYHDIASLDFIETVCETGFNAGHSAFIWLNVNPDVRVFSFDIGIHHYTIPMAQALRKMFPDRLSLMIGDSRVTLPKFRRLYKQIKCD